MLRTLGLANAGRPQIREGAQLCLLVSYDERSSISTPPTQRCSYRPIATSQHSTQQKAGERTHIVQDIYHDEDGHAQVEFAEELALHLLACLESAKLSIGVVPLDICRRDIRNRRLLRQGRASRGRRHPNPLCWVVAQVPCREGGRVAGRRGARRRRRRRRRSGTAIAAFEACQGSCEELRLGPYEDGRRYLRRSQGHVAGAGRPGRSGTSLRTISSEWLISPRLLPSSYVVLLSTLVRSVEYHWQYLPCWVWRRGQTTERCRTRA